MATVQLTVVPPFPVGQLVGAYLARQVPSSGGPPVGGAATTATVQDDRTLTFGGLADATKYIAYAQVAGVDRFIRFATDPIPASGVAGSGTASVPLVVSRDTAAVGPSPAMVMPGPGHFDQASLSVVSAPVGSALTMVLRKNGSTMATLSIAAGSTVAVQQVVSGTFVAGDVIDVNCTAAGSGTPATGVGFVAWVIVDDLVVPVTPTDSDGGPYMDLVMGEASLVSYWGLADSTGTSALDHTDANPAFYSGAVSKGQAPLVTGGDGSVALNGTDQYIAIPGSSGLLLGAFTFELWVNMDTMPAGAMLMDVGGGGYASFFLSTPVLTGGVTKLKGVFWSGGYNVEITGTAALSAATRYLLAMTFNDSTGDFKLFVNGVEDATANHAERLVYGASTASTIGANVAGNSNFFDGRIDEPAIYSAALSAGVLLSHYNQGIS